jgi:metal-responsive CopG/Arc/MetJ family transcriptional regulator
MKIKSSTSRKRGRPKVRIHKDVMLSFVVEPKTARQLDAFVDMCEYRSRSDLLRDFVTAAVSEDEKTISRFFGMIIERATKQMVLKIANDKLSKGMKFKL